MSHRPKEGNMQSMTARMALFALLLFSGCSDVTKPKVLGNKKIEFSGNDSATPDTFKFNFAFRDPSSTAPLDRIIYLQGASNTKTGIVSACNSAGTNCVCEFLDSNDQEIEETDGTSAEISYDINGNYIRCEYDGDLTTLSKVRLRNQNSTVTSLNYSVVVPPNLTVAMLVGDSLDLNLVRSIYRYSCVYNFLQKALTTSTEFTCLSSGSLCWSSGGSGGDFCILQSRFPYRLYADNKGNNFHLKPPDRLYFDGDTITGCGLQIKQYDCAGSPGNPEKEFSIYAEQTGIFDSPVQFSPGPDLSVSTYGFAAKTSTFNGATVCPPGLVRRVFFQTTTDTSSRMGGDSNYPNGFVVKEVSDPASTAPSDLEVNKVGGGDCDGSGKCTLPAQAPILQKKFTYASSGMEFCVIPSTMP